MTFGFVGLFGAVAWGLLLAGYAARGSYTGWKRRRFARRQEEEEDEFEEVAMSDK